MPLEIRELHIQVNVGGKQGGNSPQGQQPPEQSQQSGGDETELIKKCVEEVMDLINQQHER